ncbi:hypothetical protein HIM_06049 [Hirsutella minnesotensis 3608]|uniref:Amidase domain-containing protein n=1 Tax=Hirsutella minnesotensis 3608 TaxID=1043627 RepID=A0A0F7ZU91_9HYPO|nr:hypothetical protein HIM_06049 [Hirsutella minnesotensis 3608]
MACAILAILTLACLAGTAEFENTGTTLKLNGLHYFVSPFPDGNPYGHNSDAVNGSRSGFQPVTVVAHPEENFDALFSNWAAKDDVWQPGFLETVFVAGLRESAHGYRRFSGNAQSAVRQLSIDGIASGPYFLDTSTHQLHRAYRLYDDYSQAFTQPLLQRPDGTFQTLSAHIPSSVSLTIGVPSRIYFTPTKEKPLAGVRVVVKDIYDLAGVKRSNGNRAWYYLYPPANTTGTAMQRLIDAGAVIVGYEKTSQFANSELQTADWVDYHSPFNPRGDGYQVTTASSAGAGSCMGSYDWLDLAVGSDTGGSIRAPASVNGVFGNRPTRGLVSLDHAMPLSPKLDTAGFLVRDPEIWDVANTVMYKGKYTSFHDKKPRYPRKLYTLSFKDDDDKRTKVLENFATRLAAFLDTEISQLDLDKEWNSTGPGGDLSELLEFVYNSLITKQQTKLIRDPFFKDYAAIHDGRQPYINPITRSRWAWGDSQPDSILEEAIHNKTVFMDWWNSKVLPSVKDPLTCSSGIILHILSNGVFLRRDEYTPTPEVSFGFGLSQVSIYAEIPESVFPIGQAPEFSNITKHIEYQPVWVNVMMARGCDGLITRLAQDLVKEGIIKVPKTGSTMEGGEVLLRRDIY